MSFWDFTLKHGNYLSLIPFVLYTIAIILYKKFSVGKKKEKETDSTEITNGDRFKAFFINFLAFTIFLLIFSLIIKLTKNYLSINVFLFIYYLLKIQLLPAQDLSPAKFMLKETLLKHHCFY